MSALAWKARRLLAMSPAEVVSRARSSVRDRWFPPAWAGLAPAAAHAALYLGTNHPGSARARAWLPGTLDPASPAAATIREVARALERGEWSLFAHAVRLGDPVRWQANPLTGIEWPDRASRELDYRAVGAAGGAKFTAELGRLTMLPDLALAARLGDGTAAARATALLADFGARNPFGRGLHHTSGIEMALRVATVSATLALLADTSGAPPEREREAALGLLAQQALWCRDHLSLGSSANNHLLAEYMALAIMGSLWRDLRGAAALAHTGLQGLAHELPRQFHADGTSAEQAFGYLPFVWELVMLGFRAGEVAGDTLPAAVRARLLASLEWGRVFRGPDGRLPQVGDEDDGRILLAGFEASRIDLVGNALAAWLGADALSDDDTYARILGLAPRTARLAADGRHEFAAGGWTVWRERGLRLTFDHGPLGLGAIAAHGHADALAITLSLGAADLVVDPGTLAYHEDPVARDVSRGTPAHATVHFGGRSQSEMAGPFLWGRRAVVSAEGEGWRCQWASGESHVRTVRLADGVVTLEDQVSGAGAELVLPLAPGAQALVEGARAIVRHGGARLEVQSQGLAPWRLEPSLHAPRFAQRVSAQRLVASFTGERATTTLAATASDR